MADAKQIGNDLMASLRKAVTIVGPLAPGDREKINNARSRLQGSLRNYDRQASRLLASAPSAEQRKQELDKTIREKYPSASIAPGGSKPGYTNRMYKMWILRKIVPLFRNKNQSKDEMIKRSVESLTVFKLLSNIVLALTRRLIEVSGGQAQQQAQQDLQPEEFDPELSSTTQELEHILQPERATDQHQQQTEVNVQRRTRRVEPSGKAESEEDYRAMVAKHSQVVEDAKNAVRRHRDGMIEALEGADDTTFRLVTNSARTMNNLAKAYASAATNARTELAPGSYSACKAFADALAEITRVVIDSAAGNRESRGMERKRNQAFDRYLETTTFSEEG